MSDDTIDVRQTNVGVVDRWNAVVKFSKDGMKLINP